jgi:hypothetical protein
MGNDTQTPAHRVSARLRERGGHAVVDYTGQGQGTADRLIEEGYETIKFIGQGKADASDSSGEYTFVNIRSAAHWHMRELLDPSNGLEMMLPDDEMLISDLTAPRYTIRTGAKIAVEEKKDTKKRLGHSPDTGDSVIMCFWMTSLGIGGSFVTKYTDASELVRQYGAPTREPTGATLARISAFDELESIGSMSEPSWDWE